MPTRFFPVGEQGQKKNQEKYHKWSHATGATDVLEKSLLLCKCFWGRVLSYSSSFAPRWQQQHRAPPAEKGNQHDLFLQRRMHVKPFLIGFVWDLSRTIQEIWPELHWNWTPESISPAEHLDRQSLESFKENYINAMLLFLCVLQIFFETRIYRAEQMHCAPKPAKNCQQLVSFNSHYAFSVTIKPCEYYAS